MEIISQKLNEVLQSVNNQQLRVSNAQQKLQKNSQSSGRATLDEIAFEISQVQLAKQILLSENEFAVLQNRLYELGETIQQIRQRAKNVERNTTYGKISIDVWLQSSPLYTINEVNEMVERKISQRRNEYIQNANRFVDSKELAQQGLIELQQHWMQEARAIIDKHKERLNKKCKQLRAQYYHLPERAKKDLWKKAVEKGIVKDGDQHAMLILPQLIPQMIEEFEMAVKVFSSSGKSNK